MSGWLTALVWTVVSAAVLAVAVGLLCSKRPIRYALTSAVQGIGSVLAVNIVGIFTGVSLGFGWLTLVGSAVFGVPGVIAILLLRLIAL